jgi:pantetheine-phosphate adenylyltransferase
MNKHLNPDVETLFLPASPEYSYVSSTFVRELLKHDRSLKGVMHDSAIEYIYE